MKNSFLLVVFSLALLLPHWQPSYVHAADSEEPSSPTSSVSSYPFTASDSDSASAWDSEDERNIQYEAMDPPEPNSTTPSDFLRYHVYKPDTQSFHKPRHAFYALNKPNPVLDNTDFPATGIVQFDHVVRLRHLADGPERNRVASELASLNSRIEAMEHLKMTTGSNSGADSGIIKSEPTGLIFYNPAIRKSVVKARVAAGHLPTLSVYGGRYYFHTPPQM